MRKTIYPLLVAALLTFSCKKGDTGPAGPTGATGNANVHQYTFTNQGFAYVSANNDYEVNMSIPAITQNYLDKAAILVYLQATTNTSGWAQLPLVMGSVQINVANYLGSVQAVSAAPSSGLYNFKVVVIPPAMRKPGVDHSSWQLVKAAYNLN